MKTTTATAMRSAPLGNTFPDTGRPRRGPGRCAALGWLMLALVPGVAGAGLLPMWTVRGETNQVHILGSIHFLKPGRDTLPAAVIEAYDGAGALVMEIDLDDIDAASSQQAMQRLGIDPRGRTLADILGPRDYRTASDRARAAGIELDTVQGVEPWLAALMVSQMQLLQLGYQPDSGVEQQLVAMAGRDGKEITGLETVEEQFAALDSLPAATQARFLLQTLEDATTMAEQVDAIVAAWKRGDSATLQREFLDDLRQQPDLYRRIVVDRNRDWARQIEPLLRDRRDYLVVVGALHLVGPDSLIALLERAGHEARQDSGD